MEHPPAGAGRVLTRRDLLPVALAGLAAVVLAGAVLASSSSEAERPLLKPVLVERPGTTAPAPASSTTTTAPPVASLPPLPAGGLSAGASGPEVQALEERLKALHYDPGTLDGSFDHNTTMAVYAFEKMHGMSPTGVVDALVWKALAFGAPPVPRMPDTEGVWVEIDLDKQVLVVWEDGAPLLVTHVSTGNGEHFCAKGGCSVAVTPTGSHQFLWRWNGWRTSRLGQLYNPVYFTWDGIAVHGAREVPTHPASHGCVRIPMHIAQYFPTLVEEGHAVFVYDEATDLEAPEEDVPEWAPPPPHLDGDPLPAGPQTPPEVLA